MAEEALPVGWCAHESRSQPGRFYYVNEATGEKSWDPPPTAASTAGKARASHLLVKHTGSRRPFSSAKNEPVTRSKEEALQMLAGFRQQIVDVRPSFARRGGGCAFGARARCAGNVCGGAHSGKPSASRSRRRGSATLGFDHASSSSSPLGRNRSIAPLASSALARSPVAVSQQATTFDVLAQSESDCSSNAAGGDLGYFGPGEMQKAFEDATFALGVGELSGVVDTDSGVHIILRTG
jgi:hypothetical protein